MAIEMTSLVRAIGFALILTVAFVKLATAETIIADFNRDFVAQAAPGQARAAAKADGWDYLWNASGAIGTAAGNYRSLVWSDAARCYATENAPLPCGGPGGYLSITSDGGHPGYGLQQSETKVDRFTISAFTIKKGEEGPVRIADSRLKLNIRPTDNNGAGGGVELRVYVNDHLISNFVFIATDDQPISFNRPLGSLKAGDTVFVAVGPNQNSFSDSFKLEYKLVLSRTP